MEENSAQLESVKGYIFYNSGKKGEIRLKNPASEILASGKYRAYWEYLEWIGLADDPNIIILSPNNHYFYDDEDLKGVRTILNLRHLNQSREPVEFLKTINSMLPTDSFFVGSFIDRKHQYSFFSNSIASGRDEADDFENGISSRIPLLNLIYDFMDSRTNNRNLTRKSVTLMLQKSGFKLLDMTDIKGITCFSAQKIE